MKYYIGIDNGVTGSICILDADGVVSHFGPTPVARTLNYTKKEEYLNRVVVRDLAQILQAHRGGVVALERPMISPQRWKATVSAIRCDEATRGVIEGVGLKLVYIDSKEWQSSILPKRRPIPRLPKDASPEEKKKQKAARARFALETKELSLQVGERLFPALPFKKDADAALIAEWARRTNL